MKFLYFIRSSIFWLAFSVTILLYGVILFLSIPFSSQEIRYSIVKSWCALTIKLMKLICGVSYKITGAHNYQEHNPVIFLAKHQSGWETLALMATINRRLSFVYKRELHKIPIFGWGLASLGMFSLDRSKGKVAYERMKMEVPTFFKKGWSLVLFPEGTRTAPGETVKYKTGGARIAIDTDTDVIPVALNSGECWPKHSFIIYPGLIQVVFDQPISPANKTPQQLNDEVQKVIEGTMRIISPHLYRSEKEEKNGNTPKS